MTRGSKGSIFQKLTTEPTTTIIVVADYENPAAVIDGLVRSVIRLAVKYMEGIHYVRRRGDKSDMERAHLMAAVEGGRPIDASKEINGELFVNALLVEAFAKAGLENLMYDKHKRPYASQLISKVYTRMFLLQSITPKRIQQLKSIMRTFNNAYILLDDTHFTQMMNGTMIPNYLSRCEGTQMLCYKREGVKQMFDLKSVSPIMKFLVMTVQHILHPQSKGVSYKIAQGYIPSLVATVKRKVTKSDTTEDVTVPTARSHTPLLEESVDRFTDLREEEPKPATSISGSAVSISGNVSLVAGWNDEGTVGDATTFEWPKDDKDEPEEHTTQPENKGYSRRWKFEQLPPGKNLIDRVMKLLLEREAYFELDDLNRIRAWAQTRVNAQVGAKIDELEKAAKDAAFALQEMKDKYGY